MMENKNIKKTELKSLSLSDIDIKISELVDKHRILKLQNSMSVIENPMIIRNIRKNIARLLTEKKTRLINQ